MYRGRASAWITPGTSSAAASASEAALAMICERVEERFTDRV
jgi:hypothetical protein